MREGPDIARIANLVGDPARANMLTALMDGGALTASELPEYVEVVARIGRSVLTELAAADRDRLIRLALRLIPARHRLGQIDEPGLLGRLRDPPAGAAPAGDAPAGA